MSEPLLYRVGMEGKLFNTKVFWGWQLYALYQAVFILFVGMVFTQESQTPSGRPYSFWAGGHVVYFMCVLIANLVLIRGTNNYTIWGELFVLVQLISFPVIVYLDSIMLTNGVIAYFFDEFLASWTAWLGVIFIAASLFIENAIVDSYTLFTGLKRSSSSGGGTNRVGIESGKNAISSLRKSTSEDPLDSGK